ncbi:MAG: membrane protein insertion efficiency factor YidD [Deltaproteobacteria bacterium GWC2_42_11]|nr:MAG: membrane protein insertion efficiency factor YidD [Deltaproteobacteria bacterium GWC2_42_11]HBO83982.1 membrane protein insertion efficiency factor YidD [Deltaproteobacteria bacterium]
MVVKDILKYIISFYQQYISPMKPPSCRFYPTCSHYAEQAVDKYGVFKGTSLSIKRILKCHPFHTGGYDPIN